MCKIFNKEEETNANEYTVLKNSQGNSSQTSVAYKDSADKPFKRRKVLRPTFDENNCRRKYILRLVAETIYDSTDNTRLYQLIDPRTRPSSKFEGVDKLFTLAIGCVNEPGAERPSMGEAVKEIGSILELVSMSKYTEEKTSTRYEDTTQVSLDDFYDDKDFDYSCKFHSCGMNTTY
uniref:Leucine-rich repeat family protein / protein kinase family protein n=1 Tax=Solanum tuberosum TaxID=4113 RepID=M1C4M5_SOLTU